MSAVRDSLEPGRHAHPVDQAESILWAAEVEARTAEIVERLEAERLRPPPAPGRYVPAGQEPAWLPDLRRLISILAELLDEQ